MAVPSKLQTWTKQIKLIQETGLKIATDISVLDEVTQGLSSQTLSQAEFHLLNSKYREYLGCVVNWKAPSQLGDLLRWLNKFIYESLIVNDVILQITHVSDLMRLLITKAHEANQQRSAALTMPFDQKVKAVRESIGVLKQNLQGLPSVNQLLDSVVLDVFACLEEQAKDPCICLRLAKYESQH